MSHTVPWASSVRRGEAVRAFFRAGRERGVSRWQRLHGYVYSRWPYGYISAAIGAKRRLAWRRLLFAPWLAKALYPQRWAEGYHGKVMPTEEAVRLVQIHEPVDAMLPEQVIPFAIARDLILRSPDHLVALDCPCRLARDNPCLPLDVCLIVGEPFASFVLSHHPTRSRAITPAEAEAILRAEAARGHVHHAFFKEGMLGRFYTICNCCSCCCGAMTAHRHGTPMLISSGYVAQVDAALCQGCGACARLCPFQAIAFNGQPTVEATACMGCGVCVGHCSQGALRLRRAADKPAPLEVAAYLAPSAPPSPTRAQEAP